MGTHNEIPNLSNIVNYALSASLPSRVKIPLYAEVYENRLLNIQLSVFYHSLVVFSTTNVQKPTKAKKLVLIIALNYLFQQNSRKVRTGDTNNKE